MRVLLDIIKYNLIGITFLLSLCSIGVSNDDQAMFVQNLSFCKGIKSNTTIYNFSVSLNISEVNLQLTGNNRDFFQIVSNNNTSNERAIKLIKEFTNNETSFDFIITFTVHNVSNPTYNLMIKGVMDSCDSSSGTSTCTVVIAFLASLCLILFTALALALIVLRRKKPITFKFRQQEDKDNNDCATYNSANDNENFEESRKTSSIDINGIMNNRINTSNGDSSPFPRKSSLKPTKIYETNNEQNSNNNKKNSGNKSSSYDNSSYSGGDLEGVPEELEDKQNEEASKEYLSTKRKSVAFSSKIMIEDNDTQTVIPITTYSENSKM